MGIFFRVVGPCLPYAVIIACYLPIIRKLKVLPHPLSCLAQMSRKRVTVCQASPSTPEVRTQADRLKVEASFAHTASSAGDNLTKL